MASELSDFVLFDLRKLKALPNPFDVLWTEIHSVAFVLLVGGLVAALWQGKENRDQGLSAVLRAGLLTGFIALLPWLRELALNIFYYFPEKLLGSTAGLNAGGDQILARMQALSPAENTLTLLTSSLSYFVELFVYTVFKLYAILGGFIAIPFYFCQAYLEQLFFAFLPIALGVLGVPALKDRAATFVLFYLSVLAWPLGFVTATLGALQVFEIAGATPDQSFVYRFAAPFVATTVLIAGITMTPVIAFYTFAYGAAAITPVSIGQIASTFNQTVGRMVR